MLLAYVFCIIACGIASGAINRDYTPEERERVLGPFKYADGRINAACPGLGPSPTVPTSVHALRPGDIQYVGALGDSLTAALGANALTIIGLLFENRGVSWSIGGADDLPQTITFPNILRQYNPNLYGQSVGNGGADSENARYNLAKSGAVSIEMEAQANLLVDRIINDLGVTEFNNEWKLINLFIGGNDLCDVCNYPDYYSTAEYVKNVKAALDVLHARMPRTLVNLVTVINVAELEGLHEGIICQGMQTFLCDCAINADSRPTVDTAALAYQAATNKLIDDGTYDTRDDFTVVRQPFMEHMKVPLTPDGLSDFSYFAPDCFHFSKKGHGSAAIELWNNLMQPVGKKATVWALDDVISCPPAGNEYIYTSKNSGL